MNHDIYHQSIKQLARRSTSSNKFSNPDISVRLDNRLCGDRVLLDLNCEGGVVTGVYHQVRGCLLCEASANVLAEAGVGVKVADLQRITSQLCQLLSNQQDNEVAFHEPWQELNLFSPVASHKSRHQCVLLPFQAMQQALTQI